MSEENKPFFYARAALTTHSYQILALCLLPALAPSLPAADQTTAIIRIDDKPVLEYRHAGVPFKPYIAQLYTPGGVAILRDSPSDHQHHHALMFAMSAEGVDFWSEVAGCGSQVNRQIKTGPDSVVQQLDWMSPDGKVLLQETRTVQVHGNNLDARLLTWRSRLEAPPGKETVNLTGAHYDGLGARFVISMDTIGTFQTDSRATGLVVRGTEKLTPARWCAYTAPVNNQPVTLAMFDHPANPRHPALMFTMTQPFSYLSATLNLWKQPIALKAGQTLDLSYGVAVWDGQPDRDQIEKLYQYWLKAAPRP